MARMHLSVAHVKKLLPLLQRFIETGGLMETTADAADVNLDYAEMERRIVSVFPQGTQEDFVLWLNAACRDAIPDNPEEFTYHQLVDHAFDVMLRRMESRGLVP